MFKATDDELIRQIAVGNERAFTKLFDRYASLILGYCTRLLSDRSRAEDVAQEVWMKILKSAGNYKSQNKAKAWILTIARNSSWDFLREQKHISLSTDVPELQESISKLDIEVLIEQRRELSAVKQAIDGLPESQRLVLVAWMTEQRSYEELATDFAISVSAIKSLIFRARQNLAKVLDIPTFNKELRHG